MKPEQEKDGQQFERRQSITSLDEAIKIIDTAKTTISFLDWESFGNLSMSPDIAFDLVWPTVLSRSPISLPLVVLQESTHREDMSKIPGNRQEKLDDDFSLVMIKPEIPFEEAVLIHDCLLLQGIKGIAIFNELPSQEVANKFYTDKNVIAATERMREHLKSLQ